MRASDRILKATSPSDGAEDTDGDAPPCPFCGCRHHIEDVIAASPRVHAVHQCLKCGRWFDDSGPACPRCRSSGELLGYVDGPGRGLYAQYRCRRCGHGYMLKV